MENKNKIKPLKAKSVNRHRTLIFSTSKITKQLRYLIKDLRELLPHSEKEPKLNEKDNLNLINEICEMRNCNNCLFFSI